MIPFFIVTLEKHTTSYMYCECKVKDKKQTNTKIMTKQRKTFVEKRDEVNGITMKEYNNISRIEHKTIINNQTNEAI